MHVRLCFITSDTLSPRRCHCSTSYCNAAAVLHFVDLPQYPMSLFQAFGIALSRFDTKSRDKG
jgi:hypothetical protein